MMPKGPPLLSLLVRAEMGEMEQYYGPGGPARPLLLRVLLLLGTSPVLNSKSLPANSQDVGEGASEPRYSR